MTHFNRIRPMLTFNSFPKIDPESIAWSTENATDVADKHMVATVDRVYVLVVLYNGSRWAQAYVEVDGTPQPINEPIPWKIRRILIAKQRGERQETIFIGGPVGWAKMSNVKIMHTNRVYWSAPPNIGSWNTTV